MWITKYIITYSTPAYEFTRIWPNDYSRNWQYNFSNAQKQSRIVTLRDMNNQEHIYIYIYIYYELPMQSVPITTKVVSSNPVHGVLYSIQHYVIKFVSDLRSSVILLRFPPPIKMIPWYNWNIVESGVKHHNTNAARGMFIPEK
jgi:hypothetical protein